LSPLVMRRRGRCARGSWKTLNPSGKLSSAHWASLGASVVHAAMACFRRRSASVGSGALKIARIHCAKGLR
jgi:hypothetical protein